MNRKSFIRNGSIAALGLSTQNVSFSATQSSAGSRNTRAGSAAEAIDDASPPWRYVWRDAKSECYETGNGGSDRQPLWRHAGSFSRTPWRDWLNRYWKRDEGRIKFWCLRARSFDRASWNNGNNASIRRQGRFGGHPSGTSGRDARDDEGNSGVHRS